MPTKIGQTGEWLLIESFSEIRAASISASAAPTATGSNRRRRRWRRAPALWHAAAVRRDARRVINRRLLVRYGAAVHDEGLVGATASASCGVNETHLQLLVADVDMQPPPRKVCIQLYHPEHIRVHT